MAPSDSSALSLPPALSPRQAAFERLRCYDLLPKYCWEPPALVNGQVPRRRQRPFAYDGPLYHLTLAAARLFDADNKVHYHYPGAREELFDLVVRQLVQEQTQVRASYGRLEFSLNFVQEELGRHGHEFSLAELRASLLLSLAQLHLRTVQQGLELDFNYYDTVTLDETEAGGSLAGCTFNMFVSRAQSWDCLGYRNDELALGLGRVLSRPWLKRLTLDSTPTSYETGQHYELWPLLEQFGLAGADGAAVPVEELRPALAELPTREVLGAYEFDELASESAPTPSLRLWLTKRFCAEALRQAPCS